MDDMPSKDAVRTLNGREFAMLNDDELAVLQMYRARGRKFGVSIAIESEADPEELARAASQAQADEILRRARSKVRVTIAS